MSRLGYFLDLILSNYSNKSGPNIDRRLELFRKPSLLKQKLILWLLLGKLGLLWATFDSIIWSHCIEVSSLQWNCGLLGFPQ